MNESQVVAALLQFYKRQGMDLHYVLDDPVFDRLSLQAKVAAIKAHAQEIVDGTTPGFSRLDRSALLMRAGRLGVQGALTGAVAGASLGAVARGVRPYMPAAIGAVTGLAAGVANSLLERRQGVAAKQAVRNQLQAVATDPSDSNALGALSIRGIHGKRTAHFDEAYQTLREFANRSVSPDAIAGRIEQHAQMIEAAQN